MRRIWLVLQRAFLADSAPINTRSVYRPRPSQRRGVIAAKAPSLVQVQRRLFLRKPLIFFRLRRMVAQWQLH